MRKNDIINLIKCFADHNDSGFRTQAAEIANEFNSQGDQDLSEYIMSLIATNDIFVPQMINDVQELRFCTLTKLILLLYCFPNLSRMISWE